MSVPEDQKLLIASGSSDKIKELEALLDRLPLVLCSLSDLPNIKEVEETGETFLENAVLKAKGYAAQAGMLTLADDSGLEVEALGNAPGVLSARYGGSGSSYDSKIAKLLQQLGETGDSGRRARFVCAMAVADTNGEILFTTEGICTGEIAEQPRGTGGFGYDPIFIPTGYDMTFGELGREIKQQISHRAQAAAKIMRYLRGFFDV